MAELVDALDSDSNEETHGGSNPLNCTNISENAVDRNINRFLSEPVCKR